ncbi:MAG TPA: hypothetical protein VE616_20050 [Candidatus Udaeobacter sp.]|jgi:hypothetical protein|nr:hypothetical protein [Candidatus Udaeobacter sp.]
MKKLLSLCAASFAPADSFGPEVIPFIPPQMIKNAGTFPVTVVSPVNLAAVHPRLI